MPAIFLSTLRKSFQCAVFAGLAISLSAMAADLTWTGSISSDWNDPANWTPQQVPTAIDHVIINTGSVTIPVTAAFAIMDWSDSTISGSLTVANHAVLNVPAEAGYINLTGVLTNYGTINWSNGTWYVVNGANTYTGAIYNEPGGLIDARGDLIMEDSSFPNGFFINAGIFRKSAGAGLFEMDLPLTNTGTMDVQSGTLKLEDGGAVGGVFNTASGAAINLFGGAFVTMGSPTFTGSGQSQFQGTSITLLNDVVPGLSLAGGQIQLGPEFQGGTITNLTLVGATLAGTNVVTGTLDWLAGSLAANASLTVANTGVLNLPLDASYFNLTGVLTNYGTINWSNGTWYVVNGANTYTGAIYNEPGGLIDAYGDLTIEDNSFVNGFFYNAGIFRKSAGTGLFEMDLPFTNTGTMDVQSGTLKLEDGGAVGGVFNTASGAAINLFAGAFVTMGSPVFTGSGQSQFQGSSITLLNNVVPGLSLAGGQIQLGPEFQGGTITNLTLSGVTLAGTNVVTGALNWLGGTLGVNALLTVANTGVLNIAAGTGSVSLEGVLTNYGIINWSSSEWLVVNGANTYAGAIYNQPGGLIDAQGDLTMEDSSFPNGFFVNAGIFRKSAGTGVLAVGVVFTNTGTVEAELGTILFADGYTETSSAELVVSLGGATPGSGYGQIQFTSAPAFQGSFSAITRNGFQPTSDETFANILSYPSLTSRFSCLSLDLGGGFLLQPTFGKTSVALTTTTYPINADRPQLFMAASRNSATLQWPPGFPGWILQSTTNLLSPVWLPVSNACGNDAIVPNNGSQQYFRLGAP